MLRGTINSICTAFTSQSYIARPLPLTSSTETFKADWNSVKKLQTESLYAGPHLPLAYTSIKNKPIYHKMLNVISGWNCEGKFQEYSKKLKLRSTCY